MTPVEHFKNELDADEQLAYWLEWVGPVKFCEVVIESRSSIVNETPEDYFEQLSQYGDDYISDNYQIPYDHDRDYDAHVAKQLENC